MFEVNVKNVTEEEEKEQDQLGFGVLIILYEVNICYC